jgi:Putative transposase
VAAIRQVLYHPARATPDGRTVLILSPLEFLAALSRLIPPPRVHRHRYHGVLAPNARLRLHVVAMGPLTNRRPWIETHRMIGTAGQSYSLTPDGRFLYVQGAEPTPVTYLRVVPDWVTRMKRAVDEASR